MSQPSVIISWVEQEMSESCFENVWFGIANPPTVKQKHKNPFCNGHTKETDTIVKNKHILVHTFSYSNFFLLFWV